MDPPTALDTQLQQSLAQIPDSNGKTEGILIGQSVADRIVAARSNDGSNASPIPYVFGTARAITSRHLRIFRLNRNSHIGRE